MPTHIAKYKHISTGKRHYGALVNGLTKKERRELADKLVADGMNAHTAKGRILRISGRIHRHTVGEGWREWEILGINRCIIGFCEQDNRAPLPLHSPYEWWQLLCGKDTLRGVKSAFYDYMAARDLSAVRLSRMMEEKSIKEWQRKGLIAYMPPEPTPPPPPPLPPEETIGPRLAAMAKKYGDPNYRVIK